MSSEEQPYLANAHALESTGTHLAAESSTPELGQTRPPRIESSCLLPVEILHTLLLLCPSSMAVMKPDAEGWFDISVQRVPGQYAAVI